MSKNSRGGFVLELLRHLKIQSTAIFTFQTFNSDMLGFVGLFRGIWVSEVEMAFLGDILSIGGVLSERRGLAALGVNIAGWWWDGSAEDKWTRSPKGTVR